jgi:hypothetical protein
MAHLAPGYSTQFRMNQWYQPIQSCLIAIAPGEQQLRDFV